MPSKSVTYICCVCGTRFRDFDEANKCEQVHKKATSIRDTRHHAKGEYPDRLEVVFSDGVTLWYKR